MLPSLAGIGVNATYAGLRPATQFRIIRSRHCRTGTGSPSPAFARPGLPVRSASPACGRTGRPAFRRSCNMIRRSGRGARSLRGAPRLPLAPGRRDGLPLRIGDPFRNRNGAGRAIAGWQPRRREAPHPGHHGPLSGFYCAAQVAAIAEGRLKPAESSRQGAARR